MVNEERIRHDMRDHIATLSEYKDPEGRLMINLRWARPGTGIYGVTYLIMGNTLVVVGDLYDAVYRWSDRIPLAFLAETNLGYFASKCVASPYGRGFQSWDSDVAEANIKEYLKDYGSAEQLDKYNMLDGTDYLGSHDEWYGFLAQHGYDILGDDPCSWPSGGMIVDYSCMAHHIGLKLAYEQLKASGDSHA